MNEDKMRSHKKYGLDHCSKSAASLCPLVHNSLKIYLKSGVNELATCRYLS